MGKIIRGTMPALCQCANQATLATTLLTREQDRNGVIETASNRTP